MSTLNDLVVVVAYPMQIIFLTWSIWLAFRSKFDEAAFTMAFSIMLLLIVRLP